MKGYMRDNSFSVKMKNYNANSDEHGLAVRFLGITLTLMLMWLLFWVLVLKMCNHESLILNYTNLRDMTIEERIMWDLVPFNYRGEGVYRLKLILSIRFSQPVRKYPLTMRLWRRLHISTPFLEISAGAMWVRGARYGLCFRMMRMVMP